MSMKVSFSAKCEQSSNSLSKDYYTFYGNGDSLYNYILDILIKRGGWVFTSYLVHLKMGTKKYTQRHITKVHVHI